MFSSYIAGGNSFLHLQWRTKRIKVSESPPPNHVISFRRQYAVTWSTDFWATMFPQNIRRTQMFPHFLLWFLFLSILFSLLRLLFLTFSGAPDITYAIHTCTHAQNIIFNNWRSQETELLVGAVLDFITLSRINLIVIRYIVSILSL